jgi:hypothetical protein
MIEEKKKVISLEDYRRARDDDDPMPPRCPHAARRVPTERTFAVAARWCLMLLRRADGTVGSLPPSERLQAFRASPV